jgi:hypothetical protein
MDNIDMSAYTGTQYNIIGNATTQFTGTFDGNGHKISNLTYETDEPIYFVGLFGATSKGKAIVTSINEAMIKNLGVENVYINIVGQNEAKSVGGLVGYNAGTITSCYTTGYVNSSSNSVENHVGGLVGKHYGGKMSECYSTCSVTGYMHIGGLVGYNEYGLINNCYTNATVRGRNRVGGLIGFSFHGAFFSCYTEGKVSGIDSNSENIGGLIGGTNSSRMNFCSSRGVVDGTNDCTYIGGLIGHNSATIITSCYVTGPVIGGRDVGGLVGRTNYSDVITSSYVSGSVSGTNAGALVGENNTGITIYPPLAISSCFWDVPVTGRSNAIGIGPDAGGTGKTTEELKTRSTFVDSGWDFTDIWAICEGTNYPRLKMHIPAADWICPDGVGTEDLDYFIQRWLMSECGISNEWCDRADCDESGIVDLADFSVFAEQWLQTYTVFTSPKNLVAWWQLDEMGGYLLSVADSIGGHHGRVVKDRKSVV